MPVMNKLKDVLLEQGIENPFQLKNKIKEVDPRKKGIAQGTALAAWNDRKWIPNASVLPLICKAFKLQPGDFLYYEDDDTEDAAEADRAVKMLEEMTNGR